MNKKTFVNSVLNNRGITPSDEVVSAYAPTNIALVKYWGKRNNELNLPVTSSLSIALADHGVTTSLRLSEDSADKIVLNQVAINPETVFAKRLTQFLDLFRPAGKTFHVMTQNQLPVAAGLASSAAGFAALVLALNLLFDWQLSDRELSMLARLGSGSASRSLWDGFVEWHQGEREDGMDCYAEPLMFDWPELRIGLVIDHPEEKVISSREAMRLTVETSPFYKQWPEKVANDLVRVKQAISDRDFKLFGETAESNALAMHATMLTAEPSILYWQPETVAAMQKIGQLRVEGIPVYFTEDAGANLKLLYLEKDEYAVQTAFPKMMRVKGWNS